MRGWLGEFETEDFIDDAKAVGDRVNEHLNGHSLSVWLSAELAARSVDTTQPWHEDHGCDFEANHDGRRYIVACCITEEGQPIRTASVAVMHTRSLKDRLFGRNVVNQDADIANIVRDALATHPSVQGFQWNRL
jgi:hypothetical protein